MGDNILNELAEEEAEHQAKLDSGRNTIKNLDPETGKAIIAAKSPPVSVLSESNHNAVIYFAKQIQEEGLAITADSILERWPITGMMLRTAGPAPERFKLIEHLQSERYLREAERVGLPSERNGSFLSPEQIAFLQYLTTVGKGSLQSKLKRAKINMATFRGWLRQAAFAEAYQKLANMALKDAIPAAQIALADKAISGDLGAIKYAHELTGTFSQAEAAAKARGNDGPDIQQIVGIVLGAVTNHVRDPEVLAAITRDIKFQAQSLGLSA